MRKLALSLLPTLFLVAGVRDATIEDLRAVFEGDGLHVGFRLQGAFDEPTLERIRSGLPTIFTYQVRIERPRWWWFDRGVVRSTLEISATYKAVTQETMINVKQDGELISSRTVTRREDLEGAMTRVSSLRAFGLDEGVPPRSVLKVRAILGTRHILMLFPGTVHTPWERLPLDSLPAAVE